MEGHIKVHRLPREEGEGKEQQDERNGEERTGVGEREKAARQALWRVHTNHPHFNVEYENDDNDDNDNNNDKNDDEKKKKKKKKKKEEGGGR